MKFFLNMAQGPFNTHSTTDVVLEGECHHKREQFPQNTGAWPAALGKLCYEDTINSLKTLNRRNISQFHQMRSNSSGTVQL